MRRYPLWKLAIVIFLLILATIYALPSAYTSNPTLEIRARESDEYSQVARNVKKLINENNYDVLNTLEENNQLIITFNNTEEQLAAFTAITDEFEQDSITALSFRPNIPQWLKNFEAKAIALGLDLRGGVHFLLDVDLDFAINRFFDSAQESIQAALAEEKIKANLNLVGTTLFIDPNNSDDLTQIGEVITNTEPRLTLLDKGDVLEATLEGLALEQVIDLAVGQNVETLRRRVDELGVAEPVIARQGNSRIVVQLPGLQDTARAKGIIGRRAAMELRGVNERASRSNRLISRALNNGASPPGTSLMPLADEEGYIFVENRIVLTGDNIVDASYGSDEAGRPAVHISLDAIGANKIKAYTRRHIQEQLAIVLIDRDKTEVISAPNIQSELHARFIIHGGGMDIDEANELALLLRSGSLATPINIVEERTIGPSLGAENIQKGISAVLGGFVLVAVLIAAYYAVFGVVSVFALAFNLLCLTAMLAILGANLTLPGLAGFALTLGMAIDANVLINERIREELKGGQTPGLAIEAGYERAFATILDANITTLIAGLALFALGSGPVRGFAVVLCLGIVTSMFNAVVVSKAIASLVYGNRKGKLKDISIG